MASYQERAIENMRDATEEKDPIERAHLMQRAIVWALLAIVVELSELPKER